MNTWIRAVFALGLGVGLIYLAYTIHLHLGFTSFLVKSKDFENESLLIILLSWVWSSVPVALLWCSFTFVGATWGLRLPATRLIAVAVGLIALASLLAVVIGLLWPVTKI